MTACARWLWWTRSKTMPRGSTWIIGKTDTSGRESRCELRATFQTAPDPLAGFPKDRAFLLGEAVLAGYGDLFEQFVHTTHFQIWLWFSNGLGGAANQGRAS